MSTLRLGCHDAGAIDDKDAYLRRFHDWPQNFGFRGETNGRWRPFRGLAGSPVRDLQSLLRRIGFYPYGELDGVYGYRTQSSVRLFQEYVTVASAGRDGKSDHHDSDSQDDKSVNDVGGVDGVVGPRTRDALDTWDTEGKRLSIQGAGDGGHDGGGEESPEYSQAFEGLNQLRELFRTSTLKGIKLLNRHADGSSSRVVQDWHFDKNDIHLVGIRRNENEVFVADDGGRPRRANDDIFVLLINGKRLVFRGSTNPSPRIAGRPDQAFILRGQHEYRFGWHKLSTLNEPSTTRVYRAFKPLGPGPLVVRTRDDLLTEASFEHTSANPLINIHWSGSGTVNWSAGCQVIAGLKYIDFRNEVVDLSGRASRAYADLSSTRTRGAYNVLLDAMTVFAKRPQPDGDTVLFTLLYEKDVKRTAAGAPIDFDDTIRRLS